MMTKRGGLWITQRSATVAVKDDGLSKGLTSPDDSEVYSRELSFLPTIMREIESQEMLVFLSITPDNSIIPTGLQKHLSSKDSL